MRAVLDGDGRLAFGECVVFSIPLALGLTIAWFRMVKARKERLNRSSPLNLP